MLENIYTVYYTSWFCFTYIYIYMQFVHLINMRETCYDKQHITAWWYFSLFIRPGFCDSEPLILFRVISCQKSFCFLVCEKLVPKDS